MAVCLATVYNVPTNVQVYISIIIALLLTLYKASVTFIGCQLVVNLKRSSGHRPFCCKTYSISVVDIIVYCLQYSTLKILVSFLTVLLFHIHRFARSFRPVTRTPPMPTSYSMTSLTLSLCVDPPISPYTGQPSLLPSSVLCPTSTDLVRTNAVVSSERFTHDFFLHPKYSITSSTYV